MKYKDDLTKRTDISRQRKYQIRRQRDGKCTICGKPAVCAGYCKKHRVIKSKNSLERYYKKKL